MDKKYSHTHTLFQNAIDILKNPHPDVPPTSLEKAYIEVAMYELALRYVRFQLEVYDETPEKQEPFIRNGIANMIWLYERKLVELGAMPEAAHISPLIQIHSYGFDRIHFDVEREYAEYGCKLGIKSTGEYDFRGYSERSAKIAAQNALDAYVKHCTEKCAPLTEAMASYTQNLKGEEATALSGEAEKAFEELKERFGSPKPAPQIYGGGTGRDKYFYSSLKSLLPKPVDTELENRRIETEGILKEAAPEELELIAELEFLTGQPLKFKRGNSHISKFFVAVPAIMEQVFSPIQEGLTYKTEWGSTLLEALTRLRKSLSDFIETEEGQKFIEKRVKEVITTPYQIDHENEYHKYKSFAEYFIPYANEALDQFARFQKTEAQCNAQIAICKDLFLRKLADYGDSFTLFHQHSLTDQISIKAERIRNMLLGAENKVGDTVLEEFRGIVNYGVIWLFQSYGSTVKSKEYAGKYAEVVELITDTRLKKNHDYGEAWRGLRLISIIDLIRVKLSRIKNIEDGGGSFKHSEPIESNMVDIVNYALFGLIKLNEED